MVAEQGARGLCVLLGLKVGLQDGGVSGSLSVGTGMMEKVLGEAVGWPGAHMADGGGCGSGGEKRGGWALRGGVQSPRVSLQGSGGWPGPGKAVTTFWGLSGSWRICGRAW